MTCRSRDQSTSVCLTRRSGRRSAENCGYRSSAATSRREFQTPSPRGTAHSDPPLEPYLPALDTGLERPRPKWLRSPGWDCAPRIEIGRRCRRNSRRLATGIRAMCCSAFRAVRTPQGGGSRRTSFRWFARREPLRVRCRRWSKTECVQVKQLVFVR